MKKCLIAIVGMLLLSSCASKWNHANTETGKMHKLKKGKTYQTVRKVYLHKKTKCMLDTQIHSEENHNNYYIIPSGSKLKMSRVERRGSYNNGYYHTVYATIVYPQEYAGFELNVDALFADDEKKPVGNKYVIESD